MNKNSKALALFPILIATIGIGCASGRPLIPDQTYNSINKNADQSEVRASLKFDGYENSAGKIKDGLLENELGESADSYSGCDIDPLMYIPILNLFASPPKCNGVVVLYDKNKKVTSKFKVVDRR